MEEDAESIADLSPKIHELPIIQIFGYDGKVHKPPVISINISTFYRKNTAKSSSRSGTFNLRHREQNIDLELKDEQAGIPFRTHSQHFGAGSVGIGKTRRFRASQSHGLQSSSNCMGLDAALWDITSWIAQGSGSGCLLLFGRGSCHQSGRERLRNDNRVEH